MFKFILDAVLICFSFILAYFIRFKVLLFFTPGSIPVLEQYFSVLFFIALVWLAIFNLVGLYSGRRYPALIDELAALFMGVTISTLAVFAMLFIYREYWVSRLVVFNAWWIAILVLGGTRALVFVLRKKLALSGWGVKNTLILGAGEMGKLLARKLTGQKSLGYRVIGFLDDDPAKAGKVIAGVKVEGDLLRAKDLVLINRVEEIIVASSKIPSEKVLNAITECEKYGVEFKLVPGILELIASRLDVEEIGGVPLLTVSEIKLKGFNAAAKRATDVVLSLAGIVLFSPLFLVFALLIKISSHGPVFFVQERVGKDGKGFNIYKFRSMVEDAEKLFPKLEPLSGGEGHLFKLKDDPRVTGIGRFMRRFSVDELPQLINVLKGEMSLVGPRPPLPRETTNYSEWHMKRLRVRPGITGLWQVSGRSLLPFEDMVRLDIYYIENWSLWLDIKIILRTAVVVSMGSGAY